MISEIKLAEALKELAVERLDVDLFGVAPVDRLEGASEGRRPTDYLPNARSVVVAAIKIPDAADMQRNRRKDFVFPLPRFFASSRSLLQLDTSDKDPESHRPCRPGIQAISWLEPAPFYPSLCFRKTCRPVCGGLR